MIVVLYYFQGTNVNEAKEMISKSSLKIQAVDDLGRGAEMAVKLSQIVKLAKSVNLNVTCH